MEDSRYLECLSSDYTSLHDAAVAGEPTAPVPCCPGWTMGDLVLHVATVYLHKATSMRTGQVPEPWPRAGRSDPVALTPAGGRFVHGRARRPEQELGVGIRRLIRLDQAAGE